MVLASIQRAARGVASAATPRFRAGDLDNRDPVFMREVLPVTCLFVTAWFRPDIRGLSRIPSEGPVLIVGNHTGGASSPEVHISQLAISTFFGVERPHGDSALVATSPAADRIDDTRLVRAIEELYRPELARAVMEGRGLAERQVDMVRLSRSIVDAVNHFKAREPMRGHLEIDGRPVAGLFRLRDAGVHAVLPAVGCPSS